MKYVNPETGVEIDLSGLEGEKRKFYQQALKRFQRNTDWLSFDEFAFGVYSPLYSGRTSHLETMRDPLYLTLRDMWIQLGVQQGMVKRKAAQEKQTVGERR